MSMFDAPRGTRLHCSPSECLTGIDLMAERDRYKEALEAIAGKRAPSGAFCQLVARATLDGEAGKR